MANFFLQNGPGNDYGMGPVNPEYGNTPQQHQGQPARHGTIQSGTFYGQHGNISGPPGDIQAVLGMMEGRIRQLEQQLEVNRAITQNGFDRLEAKVDRHAVALAAPHTAAIPQHAIGSATASGPPGALPLQTPDPLPPLGKADAGEYGRFWTRELWNQYKEKCCTSGKKPHKLAFMRDEAGQLLSKDRLKDITKTATQAWGDIYAARRDPETWGVAPLYVKTFFARVMEHAYPEFRCSNSWKADAFATVRYPDWCYDVKGHGKLRRDQPSIEIVGESKSTASSKRKIVVKKEDLPKKKAQLVKRTPSPPLDSDIEQAEKNEITDPDAQCSSDFYTDDADGEDALYEDDRASSSPKPASSPTDHDAVTNTGMHGVSGKAMQAAEEEEGSRDRHQSGGGSVARTKNKHGGSGKPALSRAPLNPFENLIIPPSRVVLPVQAAAVSLNTKQPKAAGKPMVPHPSWTTARNLFAREYLKEHPTTTTAEFKKVWDNIDPTIAAEYSSKSIALQKSKGSGA